MISIFAHPKPFRGHIGVTQRNAIGSWKQLSPDCEIFLFGNEEGTREVAKEFGMHHVPDIARNDFGRPFLSDIFKKGEQLATRAVHCYVNCDIILGHEMSDAIKRVKEWSERFLIVGQCWDLDVTDPIAFNQNTWENDLKAFVAKKGTVRGPWSIDYFVFSRGLYGELPPFTLGSCYFDNWLIWKAKELGVPVLNATKAVLAVHQNHDYAYVAGGKDTTAFGVEAVRNLQHAGGPAHCYAISQSSHNLLATTIRRNWKGYLPRGFHREPLKAWAERMAARKAGLKIQVTAISERLMKYRVKPLFWRFMVRTQRVRHALGLNGRNLGRIFSLYRKNQ